MAESIALPLLLALLTLFGMSFTADNVGDNLGDLILGNGSPVQELIDPFYSQYLREHRFEHVTYDDYLAMLEKMQNGEITSDDLQSAGIDVQKWFSEHSNSVITTRNDAYGISIHNDAGQRVEIKWREERDNLNRQCWRLHEYVFYQNNLIDDITQFSGSARVTYDEAYLKKIISNSYFDKEALCYFVVTDYWTLGINVAEYLNASDVIDSGNAYDEESKPVGFVTVDGVSYPLNPDGSVTINGTTYYPDTTGKINIGENSYSPSIDFSAYDDSALIDLVNQLLAALSASESPSTNYTGILGAIYTMLQRIHSGVSSISTNVTSLISGIQSIPQSIADHFTLDWSNATTLISDNSVELKKKMGISAMYQNINTVTTAFFGKRSFGDDGKVVVTPVFDNGETLTTDYPHIYFTLWGVEYDLLSDIPKFDSAIAFFKKLVALFLNVAMVFSILRAAPSILMGCGEVIGIRSPATISNTFADLGIFRSNSDIKKGGK